MKVLGTTLIGELIILAIFDITVFGAGGGAADGVQCGIARHFRLTDPGVGLGRGVGLFLAFLSHGSDSRRCRTGRGVA